MWANPPEAEFQVTLSKLRKRYKISSLLVYVLLKTRNKAFPRRCRVKTRKKCTKKVWCTCEVVVLLIKPIVFLPSRCRPRRWILKSLLFFYRYLVEMGNAMYSFFTSNSISFVTQEALKYTVLNGMKRYWCFSLSMTIKCIKIVVED